MLITCEVKSEHSMLNQKRQHVGAFRLVCPQVVGFVCTIRNRHVCFMMIAVIVWSHVKWNLNSWCGPVDLLITLFTFWSWYATDMLFVFDQWCRKRCDPSDAQQAVSAMLTCIQCDAPSEANVPCMLSLRVDLLCCAWHVMWRIS